MKNLLCCLVSILLLGCNNSNSFTKQFSTDKTTIIFNAQKNLKDSINIYSNLSWTITNDSPWLHFPNKEGVAKSIIPLYTDTNYNTKQRTETVIITSPYDNIPIKIKVVQLGDIAKVSFSKETTTLLGGTNYDDTILVNSNGSWQPESSETWLGVERLSDSDTTLVRVFTIEPNYTASIRQAIFRVVTSVGDVFTFPVTQNIGIEVLAGGNGYGKALNQLSSPGGFDFNADSTGIYIADIYNYRILLWKFGEPQGEVYLGTGSVGSGLNQFNGPVYVDNVDNQYLYISDHLNHRILRHEFATGINTISAGGNGKGSAPNQLNSPIGFDFDNEGNLLISELLNSRISLWKKGSNTGTVFAGGKGIGTDLEHLNNPYTCRYLKNENAALIVDHVNNRILYWGKNETIGRIFAGGNGQGNGLNQLNGPTSLRESIDGTKVYVTDLNNNRIVYYPADFTSQQEATVFLSNDTKGNAINEFNQPVYILFDNQGNLYFSDYGNSRVLRYLK